VGVSPELAPRVRWSDEITRRLLWDELIASGLLALLILAALVITDAVAEHIDPQPWMLRLQTHPDLPARAEFLRSLLTLFGLPTTVLVALTAFAIPVLRPTATAGAVVLHRRYPGPLLDRPALSFLRLNPFYVAFVFAVGFSVSLLLLSVGVAADLFRAQLPTLAVAVVVAGFTAYLAISSIVWTLRMRDGVALVSHVTQLGLNVIRHVGASQRFAPFIDLSPGPRFSFVEQVELKQCLDTLAQQALHFSDEPTAGAAALRGLRQIQQAATAADAVAQWRERPGDFGEPFPDPWLEDTVIATLGRATIAAVRTRDADGGREASAILVAIGIDLAERPGAPSTTDQAVVDLVLRALRLSFHACVEEREFVLRQDLLRQLAEILGRLASPRLSVLRRGADAPDPWSGYVREQGRRFTLELLRPCVMAEDPDAIQSALYLTEDLSGQGSLEGYEVRVRVLEVVLNLAAHALAAGARVGAYQLMRWLASAAIPEMESALIDAQARILGNASEVAPSSLLRPSYVTLEDLQMSLVLTTALAFERTSGESRNAVQSAFDRLGTGAVGEEIDRVSLANGLPDRAGSGWREGLAALEAWLATGL